jgi:hypothetical protein
VCYVHRRFPLRAIRVSKEHCSTGLELSRNTASAEADRLFSYDTVRGHWPQDQPSAVYAEQIGRRLASPRLTGKRDRANEDADVGVPSDRTLHREFAGPIPSMSVTLNSTPISLLLHQWFSRTCGQ